MEIKVSKEDSNYMYNLVEKIVDEVGPRMPCSPQELAGAHIIKKELEKSCDAIHIENFSCHPKAFLGWIKVILVMVFVSMMLYFITQIISDLFGLILLSIISFLLVFFSALIMWEEFFNYKEFIDPIFRKKSSQNVIGQFNSNQESKRIIIFSSHIDSALQFNLLKRLKEGFVPLAFGGIIVIILWLVISFIQMILMIIGMISLKNIFLIMVMVLFFIGIPCFIGLFFFVPLGDKGNVVPGAVDNLSSCAVISGLGRYLKNHREILSDDIEIRLISFGCEESGLRGAFRYAERHYKELRENNAIIVNMDGLETPDEFLIIEFEPTTRTYHSKEIVQKLLNAADSVNVKAKPFGTGRLEKTVGRLSGGSDAAAFSKAGIKAGFINSADWKNRAAYYHQSTDTPDKIQKGTLENALKICIAFIINENVQTK
jgi:hypothetical protein